MDGEAEKAIARIHKIMAERPRFYGSVQFNFFNGKLFHTNVTETFRERIAKEKSQVTG